MQKKSDVPLPRTIDEYVSLLPENQQITLCAIWEIIKTVVPDAEELISYQVPMFKYHGSLVGFSATKKHLSFYVMSMTLLDNFKEELNGFDYKGSTIRFSVEKPLPSDLVEKIVRTRVAINEENALKKKKNK
jgi:uncharacterized protein YdhG (YjbR/CyaY superfamily)